MVDESKLDPVVGGMIRDGHRTSGDSEGAFERRVNAPLLLRNKDNYQRWSKEFGNFAKALDYHGFMETIPVRRPPGEPPIKTESSSSSESSSSIKPSDDYEMIEGHETFDDQPEIQAAISRMKKAISSAGVDYLNRVTKQIEGKTERRKREYLWTYLVNSLLGSEMADLQERCLNRGDVRWMVCKLAQWGQKMDIFAVMLKLFKLLTTPLSGTLETAWHALVQEAEEIEELVKPFGMELKIPTMILSTLIVGYALRKAKTKVAEDDIQGVVIDIAQDKKQLDGLVIIQDINTKERLRESLMETKTYGMEGMSQQSLVTITTSSNPSKGLCFRFLKGDCRFNPCKFLHQRDPHKIKETGEHGKRCDLCGLRGHTKEECKRPRCEFCKKFGHTEDVCFQKVGKPGKKVANVVDVGPTKPPRDAAEPQEQVLSSMACVAKDQEQAEVAVVQLPMAVKRACLTDVSNQKESVWAILDSGSNTILLKDPNFLWNSKTGVQSIGTAFGSERVAGVSGGIHFELGGKEVRVEEGVHSRKDLPYSLIGTGIMNRAGLSSLFHEGRVIVLDAKKLDVTGLPISYEGKLDDKTQLPMIEISTIAQGKEDFQEQMLRKRAEFVNEVGRRTALELVPEVSNIPVTSCLARSYSPFDKTASGNGLRYHAKFNHIGSKVIERTLKAAGISYERPRGLCEPCGLTKVKAHSHKVGSFEKEDYQPGDLIVCDTIGPMARSNRGLKYWVLMKDRVSTFRKSYAISSKQGIGEAVMDGLQTFKILSGRKARRIQMDGEGGYTSEALKKGILEFGTLASWSSPYDHQQNGCAEKNVHTQYEDVSVAMKVSGAPSDMWVEAVAYADFTRNNVRSVWDGATSTWITPAMKLQGKKTAFPPTEMMPFGCKVIVQYPKEQRSGAKSPEQTRGWVGAMLGYGESSGYGGAYRVLRPNGRKVSCVSKNYCVVDEGSFPWKTRQDFVAEKENLPLDWIVTPEVLLDLKELDRYGFDDDEIRQVKENFRRDPPQEIPDEEGDEVKSIPDVMPVLEEKEPVEQVEMSLDADRGPNAREDEPLDNREREPGDINSDAGEWSADEVEAGCTLPVVLWVLGTRRKGMEIPIGGPHDCGQVHGSTMPSNRKGHQAEPGKACPD